MVAPHDAGPIEDSIAREMARLTFEKVSSIAEVQQVHSRRLATIESKLDDHTATLKGHTAILKEHGGMLKEHGGMLKEHGGMLKEHGSILNSHTETLKEHGSMLKEHGNMLRQILARLPEPSAD